jgi:hypothetical protein
MRQSHTVILERNTEWSGEFATEPCEVAWASEAIFFIRTLEAEGIRPATSARIQLSPDGIHWCDEGGALRLTTEPGLAYQRLSHFGGWLRLAGQLPLGAKLRVIVYLVLKE